MGRRPNPALYRKIAERKVGRKLLPFEVVHHINEDPTDNRPENLQVMTASEHSILHGKLRKARAYHQSFMIDKHLDNTDDIFWSQLKKIDLSEIAR